MVLSYHDTHHDLKKKNSIISLIAMLQIHVLKFIATCTCRWCFEYEVYLYFEHVDIYTHIMYMYALICRKKNIFIYYSSTCMYMYLKAKIVIFRVH